jgi:hypothetical protein
MRQIKKLTTCLTGKTKEAYVYIIYNNDRHLLNSVILQYRNNAEYLYLQVALDTVYKKMIEGLDCSLEILYDN